MAKRPRQTSTMVLEARCQEDPVDCFPHSRIVTPEKSCEDFAWRFRRKQQVIFDCVGLEHRRLLELASDAESRNLRLVKPRQVELAIEHRIALVGARLAGYDVHHCGFSGPVRADDGAHLTGREDK